MSILPPHPLASVPQLRRTPRRLPVFDLYGAGHSGRLRMLHIESIVSRSRMYAWEIDAHLHHGLHQVLWVWQGSVHALLDGTRMQAAGPVALLIPPGVAHAFRFTPTTLSLPRHEGSTHRQHILWQMLHAEAQQPSTASTGPVQLWLTRCVLWHLAQWRARCDGPPRTQGRHTLYTRWLVLVEKHYAEHWPITRYASQLGLSAERLNRLVRAETGHSAQHVVHARLVREACRLLMHVQAPVSQLAFDLGFGDPAYFSRFFKRHTGQTPAAYRHSATTTPAPSSTPKDGAADHQNL